MDFRLQNSRGRKWKGATPVHVLSKTTPTAAQQSDQKSRMKVGLGDKLDTVATVTTEGESRAGEIRNFTAIASYNWLENALKPTIIVPGGAPIWIPPTRSFQTSVDSGMSYVDQDAAILPESPMEAMLRSITIMKPDFDFASVDVVTSRNNLRKLLGFVGQERHITPFRIDVELIGETMILTRWEEAQVEDADKRFRGWSGNFRKRCTRAVCPNTTVHHRSGTYTLGGLRFLVGFHVDARLPTEEERDSEGDDLAAAFSALSVDKGKVGANAEEDTAKQFPSSPLHYIRSGTMPAQELLIELHTRSLWKTFEYSDFYAQMCIGQTGGLIVARHDKGYFHMPTECILRGAKRFEESKQELEGDLHKVVEVLKRMKEIMRKADGKPVAFIFESGKSTLDAFFCEHGAVLSPPLRQLFI